MAKLLLDWLAAANKKGSTALMYTAEYGHEAVTKLLLDHGASVMR